MRKVSPFKNTLFSLATLVSSLATGGPCYLPNIPSHQVYYPDAQDLENIIPSDQPQTPEQAFDPTVETLYPVQSAFFSQVSPNEVFANTLPDVLRVSDYNSPFGVSQSWIQFPDLSQYKNRTIQEAKLILTQTHATGDQSSSTLRADLGLIESSWNQSSLTSNNRQQTISGEYIFLLSSANPGRVYEIDLLTINVGTSPSGAVRTPIDVWVQNPEKNFGVAIRDSFNYSSVNQFKTFYRTGVEQPRLRIKSIPYHGG